MGQGRYLAVDIARTGALAGMVVFHFVYDLDLFGWLPRGTSATGWFWYHARIVAGSFLFLAGLSLWLAHGQGIRWGAFWRRLAMVGGAAAAVTVVTHFALPGLTIFYGILHSIAVSSLVGLLFLRLPALLTLAVAAAVFALPWHFTHPPSAAGWSGRALPPTAPSRQISNRSSPGSPLPRGAGDGAAAHALRALAAPRLAAHACAAPPRLAGAAFAGDLPCPPARADRPDLRRHLGRSRAAVSGRSPCAAAQRAPISCMQDTGFAAMKDTSPRIELESHHAPATFGDRVALRTVKFMRVFADAFFSKRYGHRAVVLETVAAVPGMVGGLLQHLKALRHIRDDQGWIRELLDEAENERMHLMTFIQIAQPSRLERAIIMVGQLIFYNAYFWLYLFAPRIAHRIVGYLEEEAVVSYTQYLAEIDAGGSRTCQRRRSRWTTGTCPRARGCAMSWWSCAPTRRGTATATTRWRTS